jgi:uncharacterized membrane protein YphA (DoxX/SURF4 family)
VWSIRIDRSLQIVLGLTLLAAGALKILDPRPFAVSIARIGVPAWTVGPAAILLPWVEVVCGLALLATRRYRDAAEVLTLGLLIAFTGTLALGKAESCACFGSHAGWMGHPAVGLARNAVLIAIAAVLILRRRKTTSRAGPASPA